MRQETHTEISSKNKSFTPLPYDSLACAKRMIEKGVTKKVAEAFAEEMAQGQREYFDNFATKSDVENLRKDFKRDIKELKTSFETKFASLEKSNKKDMQILKQDIIFKLGSLMVICFGVMIAILKF